MYSDEFCKFSSNFCRILPASSPLVSSKRFSVETLVFSLFTGRLKAWIQLDDTRALFSALLVAIICCLATAVTK